MFLYEMFNGSNNNIMPIKETVLRDRNDYDAKKAALQNLSRNKDVDQKAVRQRLLDLEKQAKTKGIV